MSDNRIDVDNITKDEFDSFLSVQRSGLYNMFDPRAREETGLNKSTFLAIIKNYDELLDKFE